MRIGFVIALIALLGLTSAASARARSTEPARGMLLQDAARTWSSFEAMTDPQSGLPADILEGDGSASVQTSTTDIGGLYGKWGFRDSVNVQTERCRAPTCRSTRG